ncbi:poly(3-hydroxybutyrate) depolymerase [Duganella sp. 1224]|uniref:extracellular catalytic domain type 2 short-chain-length polyhydroxyalkanoate depolymerase n=1 Tax=Duganella sp. 1224 TaxID=2587052 RepID=UPI0018366389|nr:PHB depolymerase family esterase [Duganella sp. 1224]NYE60708.1 poly(3-hydroxybutyrate) depolymerase [Duganella sp. 1224]
MATFTRHVLLVTLMAAGMAGAAPVPLPAYNVDPAQTSVSGLSSGGFMAAQLHVAYSATFKAGAGIVAGGPFYCAQGALLTATGPCMAASSASKPATSTLISTTDNWANQGAIDATSNLAGARVYLYSGSIDSTVKQLVMNEANSYYQHYINSANIFYKNNLASEHAMVTDDYGNGCSVKASPYINNCNFDLAGEILKWIYGPLNARNTGTLGGSFVEFNQAEFIANPSSHGMASSGWAYVPASCGAGQQCRIHVVLHGCQQDPTKIQDKYYRNTGYNRWADTNNIILLYPQTAPSSSGNPNGCWDWWGYDDANYAKKSGRQMAAIKGMVDRAASGGTGGGGGGGGALPAPSGLQVAGVTTSTVTLAWNGVSGAAGYDVYRGGTKVNGAPVGATTYTDSGLAAGTAYSYAIRALDANGAAGAASASVTATTASSGYVCTTSIASNYAHVTAGRAVYSGGYALAKGSNQNMGLYNVFITTTLAQTSAGYYVIGNCP